MSNFSISANLVDVVQQKFFPATILIENGKIAKITEVSTSFEHYIMPGFVDAHIHIESSMLVPSEFARLAVKHGTVATVSDPHEIANVCGMDGIRFMLENAASSPLKFYFGAPSCVPATSFETSGASINAEEIEVLFNDFGLTYLSEMMNFPGVLFDAPDVMEKIAIAQKFGVPIDGHAPGLVGEPLRKYISAGISTDHESLNFDEASEKIAKGMKILIREGSAAKDFNNLSRLIDIFPDECMLCSDDKHPDDLLLGHINLLARRAVAAGFNIWNVLKVAILNPVRHYKLDVGLLQPGDPADFIIVSDLKNFETQATYINGSKVFGKDSIAQPKTTLVPINNFHANETHFSDFAIPATSDTINVIEALDGQLLTNSIQTKAKIVDGCVVSDIEHDILKIAVLNRYQISKPQCAFIKNFGLKRGAIATSVAHDSHNIIAIGADDNSLCRAVNEVIKHKGGMAAVDGEVAMVLPLPVAGLMAIESCERVAEMYSLLNKKAAELGCKLTSPYMTLSFMALLVIPSLKLSDKGLFDSSNFKFVELFC